MPSKKVTENLKEILPKHAQEIYAEAYNNAYEEYSDPEKRRGNQSHEEVANKVAWSAVKEKYKKGDDGKWYEK